MAVKPAMGREGKAVGVTCIPVLVSVCPAYIVRVGIYATDTFYAVFNDKTMLNIAFNLSFPYVVGAGVHRNSTTVNLVVLIEISYFCIPSG